MFNVHLLSCLGVEGAHRVMLAGGLPVEQSPSFLNLNVNVTELSESIKVSEA